VNWKLRNYLDIPPTLVATVNGTHGIGRGGAEHFRFCADPGAYYLRVGDPDPWRWSLSKYRLTVRVAPVERPFEPNEAPEAK